MISVRYGQCTEEICNVCKGKSYMDRDKCHPMSPIEILAIQNQRNLNYLGKKPTHILESEILKKQELNDIAKGNTEYSPL